MDFNKKKRIINLTGLALLPMIIVFISVLGTGFLTYSVGRKIVVENTREFGYKIAKGISNNIENNSLSLEIMDDIIEDKIKVVGRAIVLSGKKIDGESLKQLARKFNVYEINLFNKDGEIVYSTIDEYVGAKVPENHPVYIFIKSGFDEWVEDDIRRDTESDRYLRYGYVRREDGSFIQVGILSEQIFSLKEKFQYQNQLDRLLNEKNILFAEYYDINLNKLASIYNEWDFSFKNINNSLIDALKGRTTLMELEDKQTGIKFMQVAIPVETHRGISGVLNLGISLKSTYTNLYFYLLFTALIGFFLSLIVIYIFIKRIRNPLENLSQDILKIDVENDLDYRLTIGKKDNFAGLRSIINSMLNKISSDFQELKENQEELSAANEELTATVEQLTAAEEELRVQYEEIQDYTQKLEELQQKYNLAIYASNSGVWEFDLTEKTIEVSENIAEIIGFKVNKYSDIHEFLDKILIPEDKNILLENFIRYQKGESENIQAQIRVVDSQGRIRWLLVTGKGINDIKGQQKSLYGIFFETTLLKQKELEIEFLAYYDHLTGLPNRTMFFKELSKELENLQKGAVMLFDIDNFKNINDIMGHLFGDKLLQHVSDIFKKLSNNQITFYRFSGDEFLILVKNIFEKQNLEKLAENILSVFREEINAKISDFNITASIGIAIYPEDGETIEELLMKADTAMYRAKYAGKNEVVFFHNDMTIKLKENIEIENTLIKALNEDGFSLFYQPIVDVKTDKIVSFEALLRLKDSKLSPVKFIPVAEETNLIIPIGRWVINEAARQVKKWREKGQNIPIAINISPKQLKDEMFIEIIEKAIEENDIEPRLLEIEITESIMIENSEETLKILHKLKDMGLTISLDDFGTGYSSLNYLTYLPINKVKLDKSLSDKFLDSKNVKVVESIIMLLESLDIKVTAEGIETQEQYGILKEIGCDFVQGYVISKPLSAEEIKID